MNSRKVLFALALALVLCLSASVAMAAVTASEWATLKATLEAGNDAVLGANITATDGESIFISGTVTLDLKGYTLTGKDIGTPNWALINLNPGSKLTVNDSVGNGAIKLSATNNRGWAAYSSVISNQRATLILNNGTIKHTGGTDMAYAVDNLTNTGAQAATFVMNGGALDSTYIALRMFGNSASGNNNVTINGGTLTGGKRAVWGQSANKDANIMDLTINDGEFVGGSQYAVYINVSSDGDGREITTTIKGGSFDGGTQAIYVGSPSDKAPDVSVTGGNYSDASAQKFVNDDELIVKSGNGDTPFAIGDDAEAALKKPNNTVTLIQAPADTPVSAAPGTTIINNSGKPVVVNGEVISSGSTKKFVTSSYTVPRTGDNSNIALWLFLMAISAVSFVAFGRKSRFN